MMWINEHYPLSLPSPQVIATLNGRGWGQYMSKLHTLLEDGDEICFLPNISGG